MFASISLLNGARKDSFYKDFLTFFISTIFQRWSPLGLAIANIEIFFANSFLSLPVFYKQQGIPLYVDLFSLISFCQER